MLIAICRRAFNVSPGLLSSFSFERYTSFFVTPIFHVRLEDILDWKHLPPLGLKDFKERLLYVELSPENLYIMAAASVNRPTSTGRRQPATTSSHSPTRLSAIARSDEAKNPRHLYITTTHPSQPQASTRVSADEATKLILRPYHGTLYSQGQDNLFGWDEEAGRLVTCFVVLGVKTATAARFSFKIRYINPRIRQDPQKSHNAQTQKSRRLQRVESKPGSETKTDDNENTKAKNQASKKRNRGQTQQKMTRTKKAKKIPGLQQRRLLARYYVFFSHPMA
ncbi:hypothetical protein BDP27DRAFT_1367229 [Rhodocollybia butyracea]|uniref:Uncharacterized protein n=1 Tax=Rhodocollybia butyracea TaxID=206335 RepID=A0A9P5PJJ2_9AGAR|nr:hypothetical protein BDP27DRAFT_1367229 [Rhodocollybia butyracea]